MEIILEDLQKKVPIPPKKILRMIRAILRHEGVDTASLSVVFVTCQRIRALNKKFLGRDCATDVLAFDSKECHNGAVLPDEQDRRIAGDIFVSTDAAMRHAGMYQTSAGYEIILYVIHGILHLLGFDDGTRRGVKKMREKERELLEYVGAGTRK